MKLRIRGNSLRIRLGPAEVGRLIELGRVEEHAAFGPQASHRLRYGVEVSPDSADVEASFDGSSIRVCLPPAVARRWATTDQVSIEATQDVGGGVAKERLTLLIEKDFECLHRGGAEADTYPNPRQQGAKAGDNHHQGGNSHGR